MNSGVTLLAGSGRFVQLREREEVVGRESAVNEK